MSRSGTVELSLPPPGTAEPRQWLPLCSIAGEGGTRPRVVRVRVERAAQDDPLWSHSLPAGVWWRLHGGDTEPWIGSITGPSYCGALRFTCGSLGMQRRVLCDLRGGDYQIAPCDHLTVEATCYTPGNVAALYPLEVAAEIADGQSIDYTPMQFTAPSTWTTAVSAVAAPPGAYAVDVYPDDPADGGHVELVPPGAVRDFSIGGEWKPPTTPLPLVRDSVLVRSTNVPPVNCRLVFWVR